MSKSLKEYKYVGEAYARWKEERLEDIKKGLYKDRTSVLIHAKLPSINLRVAKDEPESDSEKDPSEW